MGGGLDVWLACMQATAPISDFSLDVQCECPRGQRLTGKEPPPAPCVNFGEMLAWMKRASATTRTPGAGPCRGFEIDDHALGLCLLPCLQG
eukprot:352984-Chlamydomonas_euryale.AAC.3